MCIAFPENLEERLFDLGNVPLSRVKLNPTPGTATKSDWLAILQSDKRLYELVDSTLVEKPMEWLESLLAMLLGRWLGNYVESIQAGVVTGPDGFTELYSGTVRGPDVAFIAWDRIPDGKLPRTPIPSLVPNFVIEVLSPANTYGEMSRKRREYFQGGVELLWMVDHRDRTITVYKSSLQYEVVQEGDIIDASPVLSGWSFNTADLFAKIDEQRPPAI